MLKWRPKPEQYLVASFLLLIAAGSSLLELPGMSIRPLSWVDAFFTVTSAVCVTGLVVFDPGTTLTFPGQVLLASMIQFGGLGIMTFATFFVLLTERKVGLFGREITSLSFGERPGREIYRLILSVAGLTIICEGLGALLLFNRFRESMALGDAAWSAVFHAVSAFCNAGFSLFPDSFVRHANDPLVVSTIMLLIIFGGLGFSTNFELMRRVRGGHLSLTAKLALSTTVLLIAIGFLLFWVNPKDDLTSWEALFLAVTPRTAGFETVPSVVLSSPALIIVCFLMYIGGSPGGTAGGIKTTTFAVFLQKVEAIIAGREKVWAFGRTIGNRTVETGLLIMAAYIMLWIAGTLSLSIFERASITKIFGISFEVFSALGTVGLSLGVTPTLSNASKIVICLLMLLGRLGPLGILMALSGRPKKLPYTYPEESISLG